MKKINTKLPGISQGLASVFCKRTTFVLLLIIQTFLWQSTLFAQNKTIKGKVTDEKGSGLPGASVKVQGSAAGASTDTNGNFTISAAPGNTLIVSFIGYNNKNVVVGNNTTLTVQLEPTSNSLDQVVVVGYGTQRKKDVTGSVATIRETALQEVPAANVVTQLQGRISGLDITSTSSAPGAVGQIRLRGERSFATSNSTANNQNGPLFVVDGVPFIGGSLNDINQADIVSIDVLKDASA
ncbi:MAG TPA: carboxypeptidase-like regulatory domain-containing protein, partial [Pedobacter sp.]